MSAEALTEVATLAERVGFTSLWATDHVALPELGDAVYPYSSHGAMEFPLDTPRLDPFVALTWVASQTRTAHLGITVLVLPYRPTLVVAKLAASVDVLSGGRLWLGVGAGWNEKEFELLGANFEQRGPLTTEAVRVLRKVWGEDPVLFEGGEFHRSIPFYQQPKPVQGADLPILVGGSSNPALRRVAAVGDGWNPAGDGPERIEERLDQLRRYMDESERLMDELMIVVNPSLKNWPHTRELADQYETIGVDVLVVDVDYRKRTLSNSLEAVAELADELGTTEPTVTR